MIIYTTLMNRNAHIVIKDVQVTGPIDQHGAQPGSISSSTLWKAVESTRSAMIVTDSLHSDNQIVFCNQAFLNLTGYSKQEVIGKNCRFLQGRDTDPIAIKKLRQAVADQQHLKIVIKELP